MKIEWGLRYEPCRISFIINYVFSFILILLLLTLLPFLNFSEVASIFILLVLITSISFFLIEPELSRISNEYYITKDEVALIKKFPNRKSIHISYPNINSVSCKFSLLGKIIGYGDVIIQGKNENIIMKRVRFPEEIRKVIEYKMRETRGEEIKKEGEEKIEEKIKKVEEKRKGFFSKLFGK